ncbi:MAG: hypothetical protein GXY01_03220 [Clostridiales bacterium]|jgi:sensor domain CHASE-containing protein|nr:hypothetical protein [Clostridiales bacterium]
MKKTERNEVKKAYPVLPYLIGLFVMVVTLVLLSYFVQLRNKQELIDQDENMVYAAEYEYIDAEAGIK